MKLLHNQLILFFFCAYLIAIYVSLQYPFQTFSLAPHCRPPASRNVDPDFPRIYVLDLPTKFNEDLLHGRSNTSFRGKYGEGGHTDDDSPFVFDTHQYSTEIFLHKRLLEYRYRTWDPSDADYIFIPYYRGLDHKKNNDGMWKKLFKNPKKYLDLPGVEFESVPFIMASIRPLQFHSEGSFNARNILSMTIDMTRPKDKKTRHTTFENLHFQIPFPSFIHIPSSDIDPIKYPWNSNLSRNILSSFIGSINFHKKSTIGHPVYYNEYYLARHLLLEIMDKENDMTFLHVNSTNRVVDYKSTVSLFNESVFCPIIGGDNCFRKSFVDSLLSGCIPVFFDKIKCVWAFDDFIDFSKFSVTMSYKKALVQGHYASMLRNMSKDVIQEYQKQLSLVARRFQISLFDDDQDMVAEVLKQAKSVRYYF